MSRSRPAAALATLTALLAGLPQACRDGAPGVQDAPLLSRTPSGNCPRSVTGAERQQPCREGRDGVKGRFAALGDLITGWRLADGDGFSATWLGQLPGPQPHRHRRDRAQRRCPPPGSRAHAAAVGLRRSGFWT